jgi:hypothetical protein
MLATRIKDPELSLRKMGISLFWGSAYNIPMMAPVTLQLLKTTGTRIVANFKQLVLGQPRNLKEEFVVTPKIRRAERSLTAVASKLKAELAVGMGMIFIATLSQHALSLIFAAPQVLSAISLPILIFAESKASGTYQRSKVPHAGRTPYYAPYLNYEKLPSPSIQKIIR